MSRINADAGVCEHIVEYQHTLYLKHSIKHSDVSKPVKKYVGQHCLFCTFYHALGALGQLPKLWHAIWTTYFLGLFLVAWFGIFHYFTRYRNPPSQAPPMRA